MPGTHTCSASGMVYPAGNTFRKMVMFGNELFTQVPSIVHSRNLPVCTEETPGYIPAFKGLCMIAIESPEKSLYQ